MQENGQTIASDQPSKVTPNETLLQQQTQAIDVTHATVLKDLPKITAAFTKAKAIKEALKSEGKDCTTIAGYLGRGTNGTAFLIEGMVAKVSDFDSVQHVTNEVTRLKKAVGIPHVVQLVSADIENGIILTDLLPGRNVGHQIYNTVPTYPDAAVAGVIGTIIQLNKRGLVIDPKPGNFMYDQNTGFYILDPLEATFPYPITDQVMGLHHMLTYKGPYNPQSTVDQQTEDEKRSYTAMIQLLQVSRDNYPTLYNDIQKRDRELRSTHGENKGFIKTTLFPANGDIQTLRSKVTGLLIPPFNIA